MPPVIRSSYLRVYIPADRIGSFAEHVVAPETRIMRASRHFVWGEPTTEDAFRTRWNDARYICPRHPRLRMLEGVLAFSNAYPASMLIPERVVRNAARELSEMRSAFPEPRSYILTAPWHVPLRWFVPFDPDDRELYDTEGGPSVRYRTTVGLGRPRVARATGVLEEAGFDGAIVGQVRDLEQWLDGFPSDGLLELDYANVARLFSGADLALDDSVESVAASIEALAELDYERAGQAYAQAATRWAHAQALTFVN